MPAFGARTTFTSISSNVEFIVKQAGKITIALEPMTNDGNCQIGTATMKKWGKGTGRQARKSVLENYAYSIMNEEEFSCN